MELIMDAGAGTINETIWLENSPSPPYQPQISPSHQNECAAIAAQHTSIGYHSPSTITWQDKYSSSNYSPDPAIQIHSKTRSPQHLSSSPTQDRTFQQSQSIILKRRSGDSLQQIEEHERKHIKKNGSVGSNGSGQGWSAQVEELAEHLAADFDGSLSALAASDLATAVASYNMSLNQASQRTVSEQFPNTSVGSVEADSNNNGQAAVSLHQLLYSSSNDYSPNSSSRNQVSSSHQGTEFNEDCRFQYVLAAATSIATKVNEETLTYLNQGQSYEIKLKKLGDLSVYRRKILKGHPTFLFQSTIRICFHERRLQYMEREQLLSWQRTRPGERLLEVDVPLSYGMVDVCQPFPSSNYVEFMWDPTKEVGVYIKVNCISTEFTPKKHGGEKGVPFRIQVETRLPGGPRLHAASCQVKVFKLKGADRKHKQDRDKVLRRPPHEQEKYQPSYDCTVLSDISLNYLSPSSPVTKSGGSPFAPSDAISPHSHTTIGEGSSSPISGPLVLCVTTAGVAPLVTASRTAKEDIASTPPLPLSAAILPDHPCSDTNVATILTELPVNATSTQISAWLRAGRFHVFESTFANFSASDILRLSRDDLIQICGLADGIRLFNVLHSKAPMPKLTLYFSIEDNDSLWRVIYLDTLTSGALTSKLLNTLNLPQDTLHSIRLLGPQGIHVLVTNELVANMRDESMYSIETIKGRAPMFTQRESSQGTPQNRNVSLNGPQTSTPNKEPSARRCLPLSEYTTHRQDICPASNCGRLRYMDTAPVDFVQIGHGGPPQRYAYLENGTESMPMVAGSLKYQVIPPDQKRNGYQSADSAFTARTAIVPPLSPPNSDVNTTLTSGLGKNERQNAPLLLILVGILTCGLALYLSWTQGRRYYFDSAVGCGACCALAGACRSLRRTWTGLGLAGLSALSCAGLLLLAAKSPKPGSPIHDVTAGALCGVSLVGASLALLALLTPKCTFGRHRRVHSWIPRLSP